MVSMDVFSTASVRIALLALLTLSFFGVSSAQPSQPNILVIWGDDVGLLRRRGFRAL